MSHSHVEIVSYIEEDTSDNHNRPCTACCKVRCSAFPRTMDVFSMFKHSMIADDVNPINKYFEIHQHVASGGPEMVWKIYDAVRYEDKKEASVFIFEKKIADKLHKPRRRETVSEVLRKEVQYLQKIKHPKFLGILHPLEECHNNLAFATEPIYASLANLLGNWDRMPQQIPQDIKDYELIELEIKYGILQITEALSYLHSTEQLMHRNVSPQSILLTKRGSWKLAGLGFAEKIRDGKDSAHCQQWTNKLPKMAQPDINYIAPEVQSHKMCSTLTDMFSLGMVVCAIFNEGRSVIEAEHSPTQYVKQIDQLTQKFGEVAHKMPIALVESVEKMINKDVRYRPTAQLFSLVKYFNDPLVSCLQQIDVVDLITTHEKVEIYATLSALIPNMPKKVLYCHVFPVLRFECSCPDTVTLALSPMFTLIDFASQDEYVDIILPDFRIIMSSPKPVQATVYLLGKLEIVLSKSPPEEIKSEVLPLVFNTLDTNSLQLQEAALKAIGTIKEYLDDGFMKSMVLPRAKALYNKSTNVKMRVNALSCIDYLLDSLDKWMILDEVLPFLTEISCHDAEIVMQVVGIYKHMLSDKKFGLTHNLIATKVMPPLIPHTVNPGLSLEQFSALIEVLREMLQQIDKQRRNKMKQETVSSPFQQRGALNMQGGDSKKEEKMIINHHYLSVDDAVKNIQKCHTVPSTPETPQRPKITVLKGSGRNHSLLTLGSDEKALTVEQAKDFQRRFSLVPPGGGTPGISLISDESPISDRPRRLSAQSLGPISVSLFGDSRRGSIASSRRSSSDRLRRPSTHSVGILPISMFGEGGEKPRRPSTHSLRVFPTGYLEEELDGPQSDRSRRPSSQSLGPFFFDFDRRGSRSSLFGGLGLSDNITSLGRRRASFQGLGESVLQLFSGK